MADTEPNNMIKHQKLVTEQNQTNPSKYYSQFLYKALIVTVFLVILPLFPSQAPEFINQTVFTRSWELLHLVFVGIAVSYGLFSRRNDETEKDFNNSKFDNAHSYVSRFLQVSSVFDDEAEIPIGSDENKVQTWSSQYYRNDPMVVVTQENSVLDEQRSTSSIIGEKPLLLPVRSLKSRVPDPAVVESGNEFESSGSSGGSISRSNSKLSSKRFSGNSNNRSRNGESGGSTHVDLEDEMMENDVLPSPIPWRSRSGRMEMTEEVDSPPLYTLPPSMDESEFNRLESRSSRSQSSRSSRTNSSSSSVKLSPSTSLSSPRKLSPSPSMSTESQAKNAEDSVKKKSFYKSSPPPPPPPPPPMIPKASSMKLYSSSVNEEFSLEKDMRRSFTSVPKDLNGSRGEKLMSRVNSGVESMPRSQVDGLSMGKSVRATRAGEAVAGAWNVGDFGEDAMNGNLETWPKEAQPNFVEKSGRKTMGFDQTSFRTEKLSRESGPVMSKPTFMEFEEEEKEDFVDTVTMVSDEDTESEDEDVRESFIKTGIGGSSSNGASSNNEKVASSSVNYGGPDVDKKADEFIAKFREQIRLQRIESIKRSSGQLKRKSLR